MTTTSLLPHKPPPLKTRNPVFLRSNYYGSVGRPSNGEWKRKSAVELLQESKAFYVKSESVLDTKQELKNAEHLHVRSPTVDVSLLRGTNPNNVIGPFPFAMCPTCPPYPHQHFDHFHLHSTVQHHVHFTTTSTNGASTTNSVGTNNKTKAKDRQQTPNNKTSSQRTRRSVQPPGTLPLPLQLHIQMQKDMSLLSGAIERDNIPRTSVPNNIIGLPPLAFPLATISSSLPRGSCIDKNAPALPLHSQQQIISSTTTVPAIPNHGKRNEAHREEDDSPPPLPPKSPRTTTKPVRPQDFPQRLQGPGVISSVNDSSMQPPPPPRRLSSQGDSEHHPPDAHSKLRRLLQDPLAKGLVDTSVPLTLPSPILPPTPPPDIVMESPMSDSGPIISPPPAFSTPVTPMLDRQNSSASDRSLRQASQKHHPLSAAMSVVSINVSVSSMSTRSRKSVPDLSDVSMRYSPRSRSRSQSRSPRSSSSAMSPEGDTGVGGGGSSSSPGADADNEPDDVDDLDGGDNDGDDDSSGKREPISLPSNSRVLISSSKKLPIPKSVTENALCKVGATETPNNNTNSSTQTPLTSSHSSDVKGTPTITTSVVSPQRRPILRSKSDLSHRYMKTAGALGQGFTLVHVDLGLPPPPPLPLHNSISSTDFRTSVHRNHHYSNHQGYSHTFSHSHNHSHHHHHHHQHLHHSYPYPPYPHHPHGPSHHQKSHHTSLQQSHYQHPVPQPHYYSSTLDHKRPSKSSSELERFFDMLGLDNTVTATEAPPPPCPLSQLTRTKSGSSSPVFFSSVSSVDSVPRRGGSVDSGDSPVGVKIGSRTVGGGGYNVQNNNGGPTIVVQHGEPSIVERNARVIKWLFNCRKATDKR